MGICLSKIERQEMVARCKARKRYIKQFVKARHSFSSAHSFYLHSLRSTGAALLQFAAEETSLHHYSSNHHHHLRRPPPPSPPPPVPPTPPPPPHMSPSTSTWTTTTSTTTSINLPQPPPPPPPPPPAAVGSTWDFWDPFVPPPASSSEEEWEEATTTAVPSEAAAMMAAPPSVVSGFSKGDNTTTAGSSDLAVVEVGGIMRNGGSGNGNGKDLVEIVREIDEYFLKAAEAGGIVSCILEVPHNGFSNNQSNNKFGYNGRNLNLNLNPMIMWGWGSSGGGGARLTSSSSNVHHHLGGKINGSGGGGFNEVGFGSSGVFPGSSHCSTVERLYAWEKKLFVEVKTAERIRMEHEKRVEQLRRMEVKRSDYFKTEKTKKEVEKLLSQLEVATQAIDTTSVEIIKLRENELYPQLLELVKGLMMMWRSMYESHQVQSHIVDQLKFLNSTSSTEPTSEIHRQSTLQLELQLQQWHQSFSNLVRSQRDYIQSLNGWLRLSLFHLNTNPLLQRSMTMSARQQQQLPHDSSPSAIYSLCEEWQVAIDHVPDKVASEGINSLLTVVNAVVVQQREEYKQRKRSESANRELEKKAIELRSAESKYGGTAASFSVGSEVVFGSGRRGRDPVAEKRVKVEALKAKAEDEKRKYDKAVSVTRAMTLSNLQMGLPHAFQAITGFSSVCMHGFESVFNQAKRLDDQESDGVKRLMAA